MKRLGILGGSFDPIHVGHMYMAKSACRYFDLEEVWLMPAGHSPNKDERGMTGAEERLHMCELAAAGEEQIRACRLELDLRERSYTWRTLELVHARMPEYALYFIMGGDSLDYFDRWVKPERICELATLLVVPRDRFDVTALMEKIRKLRKRFSCRIEIVPCSQMEISSTRLRAQLRGGNADPADFPAGVLEYIREQGLYQRGECPAMDMLEIRKKVKKSLDKARYEHTKGVMYTAAALAMANGYPIEKALLAGLLHDCAKCLPTEEKLALCNRHDILVTEVERKNPALLHAKAGMALAEEKYGVHDPEILHAIKVHTTGEPDMSTLDKIIYIADYIEPGRNQAPHLEVIRQIAFADLNQCMAEILYDTLRYLGDRKGAIDPHTAITYEFYEPYGKEQPWKQ